MPIFAQRVRRGVIASVAAALAAATLSTAASADPAASTDSPSSSAPSPAPSAPTEVPASPSQAPDQTDLPSTSVPPQTSDPSDSSAPSADPSVPDAAPSSSEQQESPPSEPADEDTDPASGHDPEGTMNAWADDDGNVHFSGYAFDRDDLTSNVTTMFTANGYVQGYQIAQHRSSHLDQYGLPYKGVTGSFKAWRGGLPYELCMFVFNIGEGADILASCIEVDVPPKHPRGDILVEVVGHEIVINGWVIDESDLTKSAWVDIRLGNRIVANFYADAPTPYLYKYGVPGHHGFGLVHTPEASGEYDVCVSATGIGWGGSTEFECTTVTVTLPPPAPDADDPKGGFTFDFQDFDGNGYGEVRVNGWAWDPNNIPQPLQVAFFINGEIAGPITADHWSGFLYPSGIYGNHAVHLYLGEKYSQIPPGTYEICLYAFNIGAGVDKLLQCESFTV